LGEEKKPLSIRGVDREIYKQITSLAKELGKNIGEVVNEAFKLYISVVKGSETAARTISSALSELKRAFEEGLAESKASIIHGLSELTVTKDDLENYGRQVTFSMIDKLEFSPDVNAETFDKYVKAIVMCNEVRIPSKIPKLLAGSKCRNVRKLVVYED